MTHHQNCEGHHTTETFDPHPQEPAPTDDEWYAIMRWIGLHQHEPDEDHRQACDYLKRLLSLVRRGRELELVSGEVADEIDGELFRWPNNNVQWKTGTRLSPKRAEYISLRLRAALKGKS